MRDEGLRRRNFSSIEVLALNLEDEKLLQMKRYLGLLVFCFLLHSSAGAQVIITIAGTGMFGSTGDGGPATAAEVNTPSGITTDATGNIYFTDQNGNCIRKINTAGIITTLAGAGTSGYSGDGGPATAAQLYWPEGLTVDHNGNIFVADQFNNVIREINNAGIISTVAGNNVIGYGGDGGPATAASLWHPADVGVDHAGNIYFADQDNSAVRKVDAISHVITTIAGTGVAGFSGDGGPASVAKLNFPEGIAVDSTGNVFIADFYNSRIRRIDAATSIITTVAGNGGGGYGGDGGPATAATLYDASAVALDKSGNMYISDYYNSIIRKVNAAGIITTIAGNDTPAYCCDCHPATAAEIYYPEGVAADAAGNVYIADFSNARVRKVTDSAVCPALEAANIPNADVNIYPNPSDGHFAIDINNPDGKGVLEIYDFMGGRIYEAGLNNRKTEIYLKGWPAGIYTVFIKSGYGNFARMITVYK